MGNTARLEVDCINPILLLAQVTLGGDEVGVDPVVAVKQEGTKRLRKIEAERVWFCFGRGDHDEKGAAVSVVVVVVVGVGGEVLQRLDDCLGLVLRDAAVGRVVHGGHGQKGGFDAVEAFGEDGGVGDGAFVNV